MEKICGKSDVLPGTAKAFTIKGKQLLVANVGGTFHAMDDLCSHMHGRLHDGRLEGAVVTCPLHGARFDVTTGKAVRGPQGLIGKMGGKAADLHSYPVSVKGDSVLVEV